MSWPGKDEFYEGIQDSLTDEALEMVDDGTLEVEEAIGKAGDYPRPEDVAEILNRQAEEILEWQAEDNMIESGMEQLREQGRNQ